MPLIMKGLDFCKWPTSWFYRPCLRQFSEASHQTIMKKIPIKRDKRSFSTQHREVSLHLHTLGSWQACPDLADHPCPGPPLTSPHGQVCCMWGPPALHIWWWLGDGGGEYMWEFGRRWASHHDCMCFHVYFMSDPFSSIEFLSPM